MKKPVSALFVVLMLFYNAFIPALCKTKSEQNDYIKIEQTTDRQSVGRASAIPTPIVSAAALMPVLFTER